MKIIPTEKTAPIKLSEIRKAAIWGAARMGEMCLASLADVGVEVAFFVDRNLPDGGKFQGVPVVASQDFLGHPIPDDIDVIFLGMVSDTSIPRQQLREAGFQKTIIDFPYTRLVDLKRMIDIQLCVNRALAYDNGAEDLNYLRSVAQSLQSISGEWAYCGAGKFYRTFMENVPEVASSFVCRLNENATAVPESISHVFLCTTRSRSMARMRKQFQTLRPDLTIVDLVELTRALPDEDVPARAWRKPFPTVYPLEMPTISVAANLDFLLLDLPSRFLGLMPNGLGFVHNILTKTGIRHETLDLDLHLYHRFHSERILDGQDEVRTEEGYLMKEDPWAIDNAEDEWSKPEVLGYFSDEIDTLVNEIVRARPKILGVSLHNTNLTVAHDVVARVRAEFPEVIVVVGGYDCVYPDVGPRLFSDFDYMVVFEAEGSLEGLINRLMAGEQPKDLPGVISRNDSPLRIFQPATLVHELDGLGFPQYEWLGIDKYKNHDGYQLTPIVLSRGCRWSRCTFCAERFLWRKRSPQGMVDEIEWLYNQGCRDFLFNDSDLSGDPELVRAVCEEIMRRNLKLSLSGQLRVQKGYTQEYFQVLRKAGFTNLRYGVDAWSKNTLRLQKKGYTIEMISDTIGMTTAAGIEVTINLVLGIPHETEKDIDEMIANIIANKSKFSKIENMNTLILAMGGVYWEDPEAHGIRFREPQEELYQKYPKRIPTSLWYSVEPYIDQDIRVKRLNRTIEALLEAGINLGQYASWKVKKIQEAS